MTLVATSDVGNAFDRLERWALRQPSRVDLATEPARELPLRYRACRPAAA
jgi:hypothetical protein